LTESRFSKTLEAGPPRHHYAKANTQRIILVLSDGVDTALPTLTGELLDAGMCPKIREK